MSRFCKHCQREIKSQRWTYGLCPACRQAYRNKEKIVARALWNLDRVEKIEKIVSEHKMVRNFKIKTLREKKMDTQNVDNRTEFEKELEVLINKHSVEKDSNTPDFLIATYLMGCLQNWNISVMNREKWFRATPKELSDTLTETPDLSKEEE